VRSYRVLEEEESKGRLRLQIGRGRGYRHASAEMERARGTTGGESATTTARPTGPSLLVGGDSSEEASATVVKTLAAGGVQVQAAAVRDEPSLVARGPGARRRRRFGWSPPRPAKVDSRGNRPFPLRCELRARLLAAAWVQDPLFSITPKQSGIRRRRDRRTACVLAARRRGLGAPTVRLASARSRGCALPDPGPGRGRAGRAHDAASGCESALGRGECGLRSVT